MHQFSPWVLAILAASPWGALASLYVFVLRARLQLGDWPEPYKPDPKSLGFDIHYLQVFTSLIAFPFITVACLFITFALALRWRDFPTWRLVVFASVSCGSAFAVGKFDPGHFVEWFFD